jgi:N-acetylmuramoyl-L-alanine amidase CwlA
MSIQIIESYIPKGHPNRPGTKLKGLKARIWHGTANLNHAATDTMNVKYAGRAYKKINGKFYESNGKTPFAFGIAHAYIDVDSVTLAIPLDEVAYSCGDRQLPYDNGYKGQTKLAYDVFNNQPNSQTWSIELCMNDMSKWDLVCDNAIEFVKEYTPGLDKLDLRHWDLTGKLCPSPFIDLTIKEIDPRWLAFQDKIRKSLQQKQEKTIMV